MAGLVKFGLLLIIGVLQVSAGEHKDLEIGNTKCEVKCFTKLLETCEGNPAAVNIMQSDLDLKWKTVGEIEAIPPAVEQCCGKESEERKCLEETVLPKLRKVVDYLSEFDQVYRDILTQSLANISALATYAENELDCCCKLEVCVQKFELPSVTYKGSIKECKSDCARDLNRFLVLIPKLLPLVFATTLQQERTITTYLNLQKYKELISKEGKCKDEKELAELRKDLRIFNLSAKQSNVRQGTANVVGMQLEQGAAAALASLLNCPSEKELKQFNLCY